ncbi:MAG: tripartite tricarboxylate transporter substrate binding protein [Betaproteobacteria bacterium]
MHRSLAGLAAWCGLLVAGVASSGAVHAQADYPRKPVRLIVPSAPGGGTDLIARLIAQKAGEAWGQSVIVENNSGGATTIGTSLVARSAPDGYTLLMTTANFAFIPAINSKLPYDPEKDFAPIVVTVTQSDCLAVHPGLPARSVAELIELAKAKPDEIRYGSGGNGSVGHFAVELFRSLAKIRLVHVPYKGTGPVTTAVISGEIHMQIANVASLLPSVKAGRLRALAVTGVHRAKIVPDLPTMAEAGVPGYEFDNWYGLWAPAGTPVAIVKKINEEVNRAIASPALQARFAESGIETMGGSPERFAAYLAGELKKWNAVARDAGIKGD